MLVAKFINDILELQEITTLFPNTSFPSTGDYGTFLEDNSLYLVYSWEEFDPSVEKLTNTSPYLKDGKVYTYIKELKTAEELAADAEKAKLIAESSIREQRNQLLKDSDWTQVADAPVDKTAWATYRQALRDVTAQEGFPFNVVFPTPPL